MNECLDPASSGWGLPADCSQPSNSTQVQEFLAQLSDYQFLCSMELTFATEDSVECRTVHFKSPINVGNDIRH